MYAGKTISLVIPCFNEELGIKKVLSELPKYIDEVIVVDNNSTDRTAGVAKRMKAKVVKENVQGYGAALRKGIYSASKDIIVVLDGDGTYPSYMIAGMVREMKKHRYDFLSANRFYFGNKNTLPILNRVGNIILTFFTQILFGMRIEDSQSGMFAIKRIVRDTIVIRSNGMSFSEEIKLAIVKKKKYTFAEYPIEYHDKNRLGKKKLRMWKDGVYNLFFLFKYRFF